MCDDKSNIVIFLFFFITRLLFGISCPIPVALFVGTDEKGVSVFSRTCQLGAAAAHTRPAELSRLTHFFLGSLFISSISNEVRKTLIVWKSREIFCSVRYFIIKQYP